MFKVGELYELMNGAVGECVEILGDSGIRFPVTLYFKQELCNRSYTLDGFYFGIHRRHVLDVVGSFKRKVNIETFAERVARRILEIIEEETAKHKKEQIATMGGMSVLPGEVTAQ